MKHRITLQLLIGVAFASMASAANWYVDNAATGANNGTSWGNAWTSFASVVWSGGGVNPGDTLYISGGTTSKTYREINSNGSGGTTVLPVNLNGTSNAWLTISVGQDAGHNGRVIIDGQNNVNWVVTAGGSYIHLTGNVNGQTNLWIINGFTNYPGLDLTHNGLGTYNGIGNWQLIDHVCFSNLNGGVYQGDMSGHSVICSNRFVEIHADGAISLANSQLDLGFTNYWVHHNYISVCISNLHATPPAIWGADGVKIANCATVEDNEFDHTWGAIAGGQHPDSIQTAANETAGGGTCVRIRRNFIHIPSNAAFELGTCQNVHDLYVENNLVVMDDTNVINAAHPAIGECGGEGVPGHTLSISNIFILNNTFVDCNGGFGWEWDKDLVSQPTVTNFVVKNNLVFNCTRTSNNAAYFWALGSYVNTNFHDGDVQYDYNSEGPGALGTNGFAVFSLVPSIHYLTQAHGNATAPSFVRYSLLGTNQDLHLAANDTAALGRGTDLSAYFVTDLDGNPRTVPWDAGAYQLSSGTTPTNPPAPASGGWNVGALSVGTLRVGQ